MRIGGFLGVAVAGCLQACGAQERIAASDAGPGQPTEAGAPAIDDDASFADEALGSILPYSGYVVASILQNEADLTYSLGAAFQTGPSPASSDDITCNRDGLAKGNCCEESMPPSSTIGTTDAGTVTLQDHGAALTTLTVSQMDYQEMGGAMWGPGDALGVSSTGGQVAAFAGTVQTPALVSGATPSLGSMPIPLPRSRDFEITWTPEARDGETMLLRIVADGGSGLGFVVCSVPDSAGSIVVDSSLLTRLGADPQASVYLTRTIVTSASSANASIALLGETTLTGLATVE